MIVVLYHKFMEVTILQLDISQWCSELIIRQPEGSVFISLAESTVFIAEEPHARTKQLSSSPWFSMVPYQHQSIKSTSN